MTIKPLALPIGLVLLTASVLPVHGEDWPHWAGPRGDFSVVDPGLAENWPADGLKTLWRRALGEGYSAISAFDGRLYTMYGEGDEEIVIALDAATGAELWSHRYLAERYDGMRLGHGEGPHSTPTVTAEAVFAIGTTSVLSALDPDSGELLWRVDLRHEYGEGGLRRGYGSSPLLHRGRLILPVGGEGGIVALDPGSGDLIWRQSDLTSAQSTPLIASVDGVEQLILFAQDEVVGMEVVDGAILWRVAHDSFGPYNISSPVWNGDGLLLVSSAYGGGARGIDVSAADGTARAASRWTSNRLSIHFTNAVRIGDYVVGSSGRGGPVTTALDAATGELVWRTRDPGRANFLRVGERLLALEEDGRLLLATVTPTGLTILAEYQILDGRTWTVPTLVGSTLYVRDRGEILALALPVDGDS